MQTCSAGRKFGVQGTVPSCKWTIGTRLLFKKENSPVRFMSFESQSFSKLAAGTLRAAPDCGRKVTAGSPWGRCWRTELVGTGWCGRWPGLCTPGQSHSHLGDIVHKQSRTTDPRWWLRRKKMPRQPGRHQQQQRRSQWFWTTGWPGHRSRWTTGTSKPLRRPNLL